MYLDSAISDLNFIQIVAEKILNFINKNSQFTLIIWWIIQLKEEKTKNQSEPIVE